MNTHTHTHIHTTAIFSHSVDSYYLNYNSDVAAIYKWERTEFGKLIQPADRSECCGLDWSGSG
jgi:hypothetical protein